MNFLGERVLCSQRDPKPCVGSWTQAKVRPMCRESGFTIRQLSDKGVRSIGACVVYWMSGVAMGGGGGISFGSIG